MSVETRTWRGVVVEKYESQLERWPRSGKHVLAQFDDEKVLVYQSFSDEIGRFAASNGRFVGAPGWNSTRCTWIKTNFLWMTYRNGWGRKSRQTVTLGIWIRRPIFDRILAAARVKGPKRGLNVKLQWDPDHLPDGSPHIRRRAVQLGLKGIGTYESGEDLAGIVDLSEFVAEQTVHVRSGDTSSLWTPREDVYPISDEVRRTLFEDS